MFTEQRDTVTQTLIPLQWVTHWENPWFVASAKRPPGERGNEKIVAKKKNRLAFHLPLAAFFSRLIPPFVLNDFKGKFFFFLFLLKSSSVTLDLKAAFQFFCFP